MDIGAKLLASLIEAGDTIRFHKAALSSKLFYGDEIELFEFVRKHVDKYNALPKMDTVVDQFGPLPTVVEPTMYYLDQLEQRYAHKRLNKTLLDCSELMKMQDHWTALNLIMEAGIDIRGMRLRSNLSEFTHDAYDLYLTNYIDKIKNMGDLGIQLGWPYFDEMSGGLRGGDILSFVGRPAMGKSQSLIYTGHHTMMEQGKKVLFVSMEMSLQLILERAVALHTKTPMTHVHKGELSTKQKTHIEHALIKAKDLPGKMWIMDGNFMASVPDIFGMVQQLNPDVLFIDGAYLLRHEDRRLDKYRKVGVNIEDIKRRCSDLDIPVVLSYQFNRQAAKKQKNKKEGDKVGLEDISFSDEVGQISSIVLGMFEEETVETMYSRLISVLKGRSGEVGSFNIYWDWQRMLFQQVPPKSEQLETMQFV